MAYNRRVSRRGPVAFRRSPVAATSQVENLARQMANQIIRERERAKARQKLGRIFTTFDPTDDVLPNNVETVTRGLFAGNTGSLTTMFTSSNLSATQKTYFQELFSTNDPSLSTNANSELSIAYGHFHGSGSKDLTGNLNNDTPTRAIYKQYAQLLLAPNDKKFTFNGFDSEEIYILNFNRARMREKLDPGNFELPIATLSSSAALDATGSVEVSASALIITLIDDSTIASASNEDAGNVYYVVSGSIANGVHNPASPIYYGQVYCDHSTIILDGDNLDNKIKGIFEYMHLNKIYLASVNPTNNVYFCTDKMHIGLYLCVGCFYFEINKKDESLYLNNNIDEKEDYLRTIKHYNRYGKVLRIQDLCIKHKYNSSDGGMSNQNRKINNIKAIKTK